MVIGHDSVMSELETALPRVSLFLGPTSVGKTTAALHLREVHAVPDADFFYFDSLTASSSAEITRLAGLTPQGEYRLIVVQMDDSARFSQDALLLTLEDSVDTTRFILISSKLLIPTLTSRCRIFTFPLLSVSDMEKILTNILSDAANVKRLAEASGGQVSRAFLASKQSNARSQVIYALQGFSERDVSRIEKVAPEWSDDHTELLLTWCREMITKRWRVFEEGEVGLDDRKLAIRILMAIRGGIRPRLMVRSRLIDIWKDYTS